MEKDLKLLLELKKQIKNVLTTLEAGNALICDDLKKLYFDLNSHIEYYYLDNE